VDISSKGSRAILITRSGSKTVLSCVFKNLVHLYLNGRSPQINNPFLRKRTYFPRLQNVLSSDFLRWKAVCCALLGHAQQRKKRLLQALSLCEFLTEIPKRKRPVWCCVDSEYWGWSIPELGERPLCSQRSAYHAAIAPEGDRFRARSYHVPAGDPGTCARVLPPHEHCGLRSFVCYHAYPSVPRGFIGFCLPKFDF
jgi:hypothetical protein